MLDVMPTFDFGLLDEDVPPITPKDSKDSQGKDNPKRLARCAKCANCCRSDCGTCYNCADKPKFGGPGIKKQACINRKCLMMVPKDGEDTVKVGRKRTKQQPASPAKQHLADAASSLGLGALPKASAQDARRWAASPSSRGSSPGPPIGEEATSVDAATPRLPAEAELSLDGFVDSITLGTGGLLEARSDQAYQSLPAAEAADTAGTRQRDDWKALPNMFQLQEEFILMNERHRAETRSPATRPEVNNQPVVAFA